MRGEGLGKNPFQRKSEASRWTVPLCLLTFSRLMFSHPMFSSCILHLLITFNTLEYFLEFISSLLLNTKSFWICKTLLKKESACNILFWTSNYFFLLVGTCQRFSKDLCKSTKCINQEEDGNCTLLSSKEFSRFETLWC